MRSSKRQALSQKGLKRQGAPLLRLLVHRCIGILATRTPSKMTKRQANFPKQFSHLCPKAPPNLFSLLSLQTAPRESQSWLLIWHCWNMDSISTRRVTLSSRNGSRNPHKLFSKSDPTRSLSFRDTSLHFALVSITIQTFQGLLGFKKACYGRDHCFLVGIALSSDVKLHVCSFATWPLIISLYFSARALSCLSTFSVEHRHLSTWLCYLETQCQGFSTASPLGICHQHTSQFLGGSGGLSCSRGISVMSART